MTRADWQELVWCIAVVGALMTTMALCFVAGGLAARLLYALPGA